MPTYSYTYGPSGQPDLETNPALVPTSAAQAAYSYTPETVVVEPPPSGPRNLIPVIGNPGEGFEMAEATDFCSTSRALFTKILSESPRLGNLLCGYVSSLQDLESSIWDMIDQLDPAQASGHWLDIRGAIVNQPRNGASDADYRTFIEAKTLALLSSGTMDELIGIIRALVPTASNIDAVEYNPHNLVLKLEDQTLLDPEVMFDLLNAARAQGRHLTFQYRPQPEAATFRYSTVSGGTTGSARGYGNGRFIGSINS